MKKSLSKVFSQIAKGFIKIVRIKSLVYVSLAAAPQLVRTGAEPLS